MSNSPTVWMNGELMPASEVRISPFDLGLTVGLGVFETMCAYSGRVFAYDKHHTRLVQSAEIMGLVVPVEEEVVKAVQEVLVANNLNSDCARVRVTLTSGVNPLQGGDTMGNTIVTAVPQPQPAKLAQLILGSHSCDESSAVSGIKSASYACHVMAYRNAIAQGADESIVLNSRGILSEGAMSNIFLVKNGKVSTPSLSSGCLAGVTRGFVIELCQQLGIPVEESVLGEFDLNEADEIFITSSAREVQAAKMLDDAQYAGGPVTGKLAAAYKNLVKQELGL